MSRRNHVSFENDKAQVDAMEVQERNKQFQARVLEKGFDIKDSLAAVSVALDSTGILSQSTLSFGDKEKVRGVIVRIGDVALICSSKGDIRDVKAETGVEERVFNKEGLINLGRPEFNCEENKLLVLNRMLEIFLTGIGRDKASIKELVAEKIEDATERQSVSRGKEKAAASSDEQPGPRPQKPTFQQLAPQQQESSKAT